MNGSLLHCAAERLLAERGINLATVVTAWRRERRSWLEIESLLRDGFDLDVSRSTVARWFSGVAVDAAPLSAEERFWRYVQKTETCWLWTGTKAASGYGQFSLRVAPSKKKTARAHRVSYEMFVGPIPDGLTIDHLCRVPSCVNPAHLEPVTGTENTRRHFWHRRGEVRFCGKGHEFTPENTYETPKRGHRVCRACRVEYDRARGARRQESVGVAK